MGQDIQVLTAFILTKWELEKQLRITRTSNSNLSAFLLPIQEQELDQYITEILKDRQQTGIARYKDAPTQSKLIGIGDYLKAVEETHNVNALFILATAIHESDYGISANAQTKNNIFGIKVFDSSPDKGEMYATSSK